jgi:hypothetical protein
VWGGKELDIENLVKETFENNGKVNLLIDACYSSQTWTEIDH